MIASHEFILDVARQGELADELFKLCYETKFE